MTYKLKRRTEPVEVLFLLRTNHKIFSVPNLRDG